MNKRVFPAAILTVAAMLSSAAVARQQTEGAKSGSPKDRWVEDRYRSDELRRVRRAAEKPESHPAPNFPQIKEDFERIQTVNSEVLQTRTGAGAAPDYTRISEAAWEIKKRAERLKSNLFPSEAEKHAAQHKQDAEHKQDAQHKQDAEHKQGAEHETEAEEQKGLKSLLSALDDAIYSFVSNPTFKNLQVLNAEDSARARRDLEKVVKLSDGIGREADKRKN
ncbi:MAG TPA: hypothetical protein VM934_06950 [Pyrinomonadaceae bacterium]|nr:hypothetical protein [Pyrinomonadaceae bacterium]